VSGAAEAAPHLCVRVVEQRSARRALPRAQALCARAERNNAQCRPALHRCFALLRSASFTQRHAKRALLLTNARRARPCPSTLARLAGSRPEPALAAVLMDDRKACQQGVLARPRLAVLAQRCVLRQHGRGERRPSRVWQGHPRA